jgi:hypothetical protein
MAVKFLITLPQLASGYKNMFLYFSEVKIHLNTIESTTRTEADRKINKDLAYSGICVRVFLTIKFCLKI